MSYAVFQISVITKRISSYLEYSSFYLSWVILGAIRRGNVNYISFFTSSTLEQGTRFHTRLHTVLKEKGVINSLYYPFKCLFLRSSPKVVFRLFETSVFATLCDNIENFNLLCEKKKSSRMVRMVNYFFFISYFNYEIHETYRDSKCAS